MKIIKKLAPNQVFVFGSNSKGFHGAGAAGYACRGTSENNWRSDPWFLKAINSPVGSPDRVGKWAVFGVARGLQIGSQGSSYAIETVIEPGHKRSIPLEEIGRQLVLLYNFAWEHPTLDFIMTPVGAGLAGYTEAEMAKVLEASLCISHSPNVIIPDNLYGNITWKDFSGIKFPSRTPLPTY